LSGAGGKSPSVLSPSFILLFPYHENLEDYIEMGKVTSPIQGELF